MLNKVALIGLPRVGKDYVFNRCGIKPHSVSAPMLAVAESYFPRGLDIKGRPGGRHMLQQLGHWGRGTVNDEYPLSFARGREERVARNFYELVQATPTSIYAPVVNGLDLLSWGTGTFWVSRFPNGALQCYVTGVRFQDEVDYLKQRGFSIFAVRCPEVERLRFCKDGDDRHSENNLFAGALCQCEFCEGKIKPIPGVECDYIWNSNAEPPDNDAMSIEDFSKLIGAAYEPDKTL